MSGEQIFTIYIWFFQIVGMFLFALDEVVFFKYGVIELTCLGFFLIILDYKLLMWFIMRMLGLYKEEEEESLTDEEYNKKTYKQRQDYYKKKYKKSD